LKLYFTEGEFQRNVESFVVTNDVIDFIAEHVMYGYTLRCNRTVISWLTFYLSSRSFVVSINSTSSAPSPLRQGVPQGSVLGPLLFILYATPLSTLISDSSVGRQIFADDTQYCSSPSGHLNYPPIFYTYKIQLVSSLNGCLQIFSHSINLKLSFFLLAYLLNYLKSLILLF